ncbi:MAG: hypothetical protein C4530_24755 [Desulfobacteraceae bacterium]|nr:MAG: hypothetical protein C4530_24755 [Desulfobacteraceae bacterium]
MNDGKVIITVAVTGSFGDRKTHYLPITPEEIASSALGAHEAGAAVADACPVGSFGRACSYWNGRQPLPGKRKSGSQ